MPDIPSVPVPPAIEADLGPLAGPFSTALVPKAIAMLSAAIATSAAGHMLTTDQDTTIASYAVSAALLGLSGVLTWLRTKMQARKLVAAAATGNPKADPAAPETKVAVTAAIVGPNPNIKGTAP